VVAVLSLGGCTWSQSRYDASQSGFNPYSGWNATNIGDFGSSAGGWHADAEVAGTPLVRDGKLYQPTTNAVNVYDAQGQTSCASSICQPLFRTPNFAPDDVAIAGATLVVRTGSALRVYDANGRQACGGSPLTCLPLWTDTLPVGADFSTLGGLTTTNDQVLMHYGDCGPVACLRGATPRGKVLVWDAHGVTNCSGTPKRCDPVFTGTTNLTDFGSAAPTVANRRIYVTVIGPTPMVAIFDAAGVTNCSGLPKVCTPIANIAADGFDDEVPVVNGVAYASTGLQSGRAPVVGAFDADGGTTPLWTTSETTFAAPPAVANGKLYVPRDDGNELAVAVYDASGTTNCSGTPKLCRPLFTAIAGDAAAGSTPLHVVVAGDLLNVTRPDRTSFFDANGERDCSAAPVRCRELLSFADFGFVGHPTFVNDFWYQALSLGLNAFRAP
jgi:hypothetical protein